MAKKTEMTKFVHEDKIYLREPNDDKLEAVFEWMAETALLNIVDTEDCLAIFTPSGRGKQRPALAIQFESAIADPNAIKEMGRLYPMPFDVSGIAKTEPAEVKSLEAHYTSEPAPGHVSIAEVMDGEDPAPTVYAKNCSEESPTSRREMLEALMPVASELESHPDFF